MKQESALTIKHTKTPECKLCNGLCCIAFLIDTVEGNNFKEVGEICKHLNCSRGNCNIYKDRRGLGLDICEDYSCYGAGEVVSNWTREVFPGFDRKNIDNKFYIYSPDWYKIAKIVDEVFLVTAFVYQKLNLMEETKSREDLSGESMSMLEKMCRDLSSDLDYFLKINTDYYTSKEPSQIKLTEMRTLESRLIEGGNFSFTIKDINGNGIEIFLK